MSETDLTVEAMRYEDSDIDPRILRAVTEMGFSEMTPIQQQAIPLLMEGRDVIGQAQTGTERRRRSAFPCSESGGGKPQSAGADPLPDEGACHPGGGGAAEIFQIYAWDQDGSHIRRTGYHQADQGAEGRRAGYCGNARACDGSHAPSYDQITGYQNGGAG